MCRWCTILLVAEVQSIDKRLSWCYVSLSTETARNLLPHCSEWSSSSSHPIDSWTWKVDGDLRVANRWTYQSHRGRQREIAADPAKLFQVFFNTISMMKTRIKGFMREADVKKTVIDVKLYSTCDSEKRVNLWVLWASRISAAVFHSEEMIRAEWELLLFIHTYIYIHTPYILIIHIFWLLSEQWAVSSAHRDTILIHTKYIMCGAKKIAKFLSWLLLWMDQWVLKSEWSRYPGIEGENMRKIFIYLHECLALVLVGKWCPKFFTIPELFPLIPSFSRSLFLHSLRSWPHEVFQDSLGCHQIGNCWVFVAFFLQIRSSLSLKKYFPHCQEQ